MGSTAIVALLALILILVKLSAPAFNFSRSPAEFREGFYFSVVQSSQTIYDDIDNAVLARLSTLEATGIYGVAYRLVEVSLTPVAAMLLAAYPKVFRVSADGIPATLRHIRPLVVRALGYAAFVVIVLFHFFLADALTGAGYQALRTAISAGAAVFNVCINMWIIPAYSWRGAAWSSIATDTLLLSAFATAAVGLARRSQHLVGRTKVIEARAEA